MQPYPPPPPPPPPPGFYYPPPPPPLGPEPSRSYAMVALVITAVASAALLIIALGINGTINEGEREARLANKIVWMLILCGAVGVLESVRGIYGRWQSALAVGLTHLVLGIGVAAIGVLLSDARNMELSTGLSTLLGLGVLLLVSGTMALIAIPQVSAYGRWKQARDAIAEQSLYPPPPPPPPPGYYYPPPPPQ